MSHSQTYLAETADIAEFLVPFDIENMAQALSDVKGRIFLIGLGGSAANCIHMAADLRKLCNIDAYALDNIAELTARANDEGFESIFSGWLSRIGKDDALFVLSVGGGTSTVSNAICKAIDHAKARGAKVFGIVGPHGGYTAEHGDLVIKVPVANQKHVTPHTEAFQAVLWHLLVSHPLLQKSATKW
jgi:D-sedoheptulose 7-phosphate isomerase